MKINQVKQSAGLMSCTLEHEVQKTTARYDWTGPKISPEVWNQVLAYFRWTYDLTKSESQVRLYANATLGTWAAWAYPQRANTGMTAHEIDSPEASAQRAQFSDADGWVYYGTVHHHCSGSAFQSSVDESNERNQDGLHITVGKMDQTQYDLNARVYQSSFLLTGIDLDSFWDIGQVVSELPFMVRAVLPKDFEKQVAHHQMGVPPPADTEFPQQWKDNLIFIAPVSVSVVNPHQSMVTGGHFNSRIGFRDYFARSAHDVSWDAKRAMSAISEWMEEPRTLSLSVEDLLEMLQGITFLSPEQMILFDIMCRNDVSPEFLQALLLTEKSAIEQSDLKKVNKKLKQIGNTPEQSTMDYEGPNQHYHGYGSGLGLGG